MIKFKNKLPILIILFSLLLFLFSCKKEVEILGFAYRNDKVTIIKDDRVFSILVNGNEDENKLCYFYKKLNLTSYGKDIKIKINLDSSKVRLLDTIIVISSNNKEPFISFLYPSNETRFNRTVFIADQADSTFIKY